MSLLGKNQKEAVPISETPMFLAFIQSRASRRLGAAMPGSSPSLTGSLEDQRPSFLSPPSDPVSERKHLWGIAAAVGADRLSGRKWAGSHRTSCF